MVSVSTAEGDTFGLFANAIANGPVVPGGVNQDDQHMTLNQLLTDERGVSPVVGVALLIAMTVILAAVIGAVVLGIGVGPADSPQATLSFETAGDDGDIDVTLAHNGGETLNADEINVSVDGDGDPVDISDDLSSGDREKIVENADSGDRVTIVWNDSSSGQSTVLAEYTV